ncbi:MAG TPA: hypothetical protein PL196_07050 [Burkholderiaceae bacterium]|nr:hypothetical protein [Burkholderiaceae bacterium]
MNRLRALVAWAAIVLLLSGCQSTSIRSAWFDTSFAGPPMARIVVAGNFQRTSDGRLLEDIVVAKLRAAGVDGIAAYALRMDDPSMTQETFRAAVVDSGAQGLLLVSLLGVDTRTQVTTTMVHGGMGWGPGPWGWGGPGWGGVGWTSIPVQQVNQYDLATVETKLFDVKTRQIVWAATTTTLNPTSVAREAPGFADLIVGELASRRIIASK